MLLAVWDWQFLNYFIRIYDFWKSVVFSWINDTFESYDHDEWHVFCSYDDKLKYVLEGCWPLPSGVYGLGECEWPVVPRHFSSATQVKIRWNCCDPLWKHGSRLGCIKFGMNLKSLDLHSEQTCKFFILHVSITIILYICM